MANIKISELPAAASVTTTDILVLNQGSTTRKATVAQALVGALTTDQIAGLTTSPAAALATTGVAGLSNYAARADHQHLFPTAAEVGAPPTSRTISAGTGLTGGGDLSANRTLTVSYGTTAGTAAQGNDSRLSDSRTPSGAAGGDLGGTYPNPTINTVAVNKGGTGQTSYTDGQLLIGNSTGGLTKATITGTNNIGVTNGNGSISIESTAGAYLEVFEHFMSTTLSGNMSFAATGGSHTQVNAGLGIVAMSTGATASANQQSRLNQAATNAVASAGVARAIFRFAQSGATWFDETLTGALRCGWGDSTTGESANAIYFRSQNGQGIDFITKSGNIETLTSTGVSFANGVFRNLEILTNSTGTQVVAKIDGVTVATHTTNIPSSRLIFFAHINRVAATATAVIANIDFVYSRITPNTPFF